jgi:nitrogen regulatory protein PII 1
MKLITAVVRDTAVVPLQAALAEAGHSGISRWNVIGRGRQHGIRVGEVVYDELAKTMLYIVVEDGEKDAVVDLVIRTAQSEGGQPGDGRVFVSDIAESYTISSQSKDEEG